jgi:hypothetical protein
MVRAFDVYKNVLDFLAGDFKWIQAESVFWRRSLWEAAGGFINEDYKLMVDGELWTRFFRFDPLWHAHCILGGFRMHGRNRSAVAMAACVDDMHRAIEEMRPRIDVDSLGLLRANYPLLRYNWQKSRWMKQVARRHARA